MNSKETSSLPVMVLHNENNRKKSAGKSKTKKTTTIPNNIHVGFHDFVVPPSNGMQVVRIAIQIQIIEIE